MNYSVLVKAVQCPYCWETFETTVDSSELVEGDSASYTEDCYVCCRPILITMQDLGGTGQISISVEAELV